MAPMARSAREGWCTSSSAPSLPAPSRIHSPPQHTCLLFQLHFRPAAPLIQHHLFVLVFVAVRHCHASSFSQQHPSRWHLLHPTITTRSAAHHPRSDSIMFSRATASRSGRRICAWKPRSLGRPCRSPRCSGLLASSSRCARALRYHGGSLSSDAGHHAQLQWCRSLLSTF
eukprot:1160499-Rhodomonas_salina.2